MNHRVALAIVTGLLAACDTFEPSSPQVEVFRTFPSELAPPGFGYSSSTGPAVAIADTGNMNVTGHLEGQLHGIPLSGDTTQNYGRLEEWQSGGYMDMNVAMESQAGAGMLMLGIEGGMEHPLFREGSWSSARAASATSVNGTSNFISVLSCAGPTIGQWPFEQTALDYEMTAEPDPEDPGAVVLVISGSFFADVDATETNDVSATIRFSRIE